MALIICTECGKQFSDRADACPNCGCPTDIILDELNKKERAIRAGADTVVAEYNILGETFVVTSALHKSLGMSKTILSVGSQLSAEIEKTYNGLGSIDKVLEFIPEELANTIDILTDGVVELLITCGIYEYDKNRFFEKYRDAYDTSGFLRPIVEQYLKILDMGAKIEEYHDYIAKSRRNYWRGGGFGVSGAIKGAIQAQLLNYGNAFLHSIPDSYRR